MILIVFQNGFKRLKVAQIDLRRAPPPGGLVCRDLRLPGATGVGVKIIARFDGGVDHAWINQRGRKALCTDKNGNQKQKVNFHESPPTRYLRIVCRDIDVAWPLTQEILSTLADNILMADICIDNTRGIKARKWRAPLGFVLRKRKCSFGAMGVGRHFRLGTIENPTFRRGLKSLFTVPKVKFHRPR